MRPRPVGRGNPCPPDRFRAGSPASMRPATSWSRKSAASSRSCRQWKVVASMRPRPVGRGKSAPGSRDYSHTHLASMRPRPVGRGNTYGWSKNIKCKCGFNEAATSWSRKSRGRRSGRGSGDRASMRPRPVGRGNPPPPGLTLSPPLASMRPRPVGRGNGGRTRTTRRGGSGFNEAATSWSRKSAGPRRRFAGPVSRFNEAATSWSRKSTPPRM